MGSQCSYEGNWDYAYAMTQTAHGSCVLPDIGIDESLHTYSGLNSNAALKTYGDQLIKDVPDYTQKFGNAFGALSVVPNAVGLGALVISLIMEIAMKSTQGQPEETYSILQRIFSQEKASNVRDVMSEYLKRHQQFLSNNQHLLSEIHRLEELLSIRLTALRNSLQHDGQMSTRGFKIWVNGAAFHLQMRIHEARLKAKNGIDVSDSVRSIEIATDQYLSEVGKLLEKYKEYKHSVTLMEAGAHFSDAGAVRVNCHVKDYEKPGCTLYHKHPQFKTCTSGCNVKKFFIDMIIPDAKIKSYFSDLKSNINTVVHQDASFTVPSAA